MSGISQPARNDALRNGGIGFCFIIASVLVALGAYAMGDTAQGVDAVAYWLFAAFIVAGLFIVGVILISHWRKGEKDCDWNDQLAKDYKPRTWRRRSEDNPAEHTGGIDYSGEWPNGLATFIGPGGETITVQSGYNESTGEYWQEIS